MAKLKGPIDLQGSIGNITFYKGRDGSTTAKQKNTLPKSRYKSDNSFERSRENNAEFTSAVHCGKLIRDAVETLFLFSTDKDYSTNLSGRLTRIVQSDCSKGRGKRKVINCDFRLLRGHDFNMDSCLCHRLYQPFETIVDRDTCKVSVLFEDFVAAAGVNAPKEARDFCITMAAVLIDFDHEEYSGAVAESRRFPNSAQKTGPLEFSVDLTRSLENIERNNEGEEPSENGLRLFVILGIEFYELVLGKDYPLEKGIYNATAIVHTETW